MSPASNVPDHEKCKTKHLNEDLYYCVTHNAHLCRYSIGLGNEYYCDHRERHNFKISDQAREKSNYGL